MELSKKSTKVAIVVVGPTAVSKTEMAIKLASQHNTEIVSADSRQFFRELNIGTAKPDIIQLNTVKHHFINSHSITDLYNAGIYERDALKKLEDIFRSNSFALIVGGSGMYINALCYGLDEIPKVPKNIREGVNKKFLDKGLDYLTMELEISDPVYFKSVDLKNSQRIIRALEVIEFTGERFSSFVNKRTIKERPFKMIKIGLEIDRQELYSNINQRMDRMIESGLFEEAEKLHAFRNLYALQTVGYTEIFDYLEGRYNKDEAIRLLKRNSRRYAKRQLTWFKRDDSIVWYTPDDEAGIDYYIRSKVKSTE
ncbi:MAG: tRNA (adenosine(37)-N6)-dimethylallyltransferase MiaA [Bacteroidetes bacterium]|nr:tRNA (adenosine(37)-N6)-dimethylallyltransferase MiaA [Bacteroidota bacterium]MDA1120931.1 tRNA (adenosine(37)-N6)-dimethylallyltransferase MiaA [Bacteroidota bacterium]